MQNNTIITALVTPLGQNFEVDYKSLENLILYQLENKIPAICILGSTGEGELIDFSTRGKIISFAKSVIRKKAKLFVGISSTKTSEAVLLANQAKLLGADGVLVSPPHYIKCTQNGLVQHYKKICDVGIDVIVYNVPSRTNVNISPKIWDKLLEIKNIVGLKEASTEMDHIMAIYKKLKGKIPIYSGNDNLNLVHKALGASGAVSVISNALPKEVIKDWQNGENRLQNLYELAFLEPNPIPIKYILFKMGKIKNILLPPLLGLENKHKKQINLELKRLGLI